ncbi:MAG: methylated-DNA--[protein]-cysteine S-methyltransferase [Porphyromonadaceae bacterium]|nr:methylated-DNA--[protein]-cysteine S-methyltransferase [Porphyromonadaceae bacterium]
MGSDKLRIDYDLYDTHYGSLLIASTHVGVCYSTFCTSAEAALDILRLTFGQAQIFRATAQWHRRLLSCLKPSDSADDCISLHLMGSEFRLKVWRALLEVPLGSVATYSDLAQAIGSPKAVRAVGSAVASNPIVPFIPCHRIIRRDGSLGNYSAEGGTERKAALLFMEQAILPSI